MSKYTNCELKKMAEEVMIAKGNGNINYHMLIQTLSVGFRMHPQLVEKEVQKLSQLSD